MFVVVVVFLFFKFLPMIPTEKDDRDISNVKLLEILREDISNIKRPPNEVILDEVAFCDLLHISKRHAANLRAKKLITYSKLGGRIYYLLSAVLIFIEKNEIKCIDRNNSIFKPKMNRK